MRALGDSSMLPDLALLVLAVGLAAARPAGVIDFQPQSAMGGRLQMNNEIPAPDDLWRRHFPWLAASSDPEIRRMVGAARLVKLPPETRVFEPGLECHNYLLVAEGTVRVQLLTEGGREVVLYYVRPGESCILTTSCLMGGDGYPAEGVTQTWVTAFVVASGDFHRALDHSPGFRKFVFTNFGQRLAEVIARLEQVAFSPIDNRLAAALLRDGAPGRPLQTTHQALAAELGTAREVVSRHLKRFEARGWVALGRGTITVKDPAALERLTGAL